MLIESIFDNRSVAEYTQELHYGDEGEYCLSHIFWYF